MKLSTWLKKKSLEYKILNIWNLLGDISASGIEGLPDNVLDMRQRLNNIYDIIQEALK